MIDALTLGWAYRIGKNSKSYTKLTLFTPDGMYVLEGDKLIGFLNMVDQLLEDIEPGLVTDDIKDGNDN